MFVPTIPGLLAVMSTGSLKLLLANKLPDMSMLFPRFITEFDDKPETLIVFPFAPCILTIFQKFHLYVVFVDVKLRLVMIYIFI